MSEQRVLMIIICLIILSMLATTKKPWNPNKTHSLDTDWDQIDLSSFLSNINIINIDKNDISFTGNDYTNATNCEIVAEIIRTINATHYNSLLGMKDIIKYNNNILKVTESRNKSIAICNKKIKYCEAKINRMYFLLSKTAKVLPVVPLLDYQTMEKAQNILKNTSCDDLTFTEEDFKHDIDTEPNIIINKPRFELNINDTNDINNKITIPIATNNKIDYDSQSNSQSKQLSPISAFPLGTIGGAIDMDTIKPTSISLEQDKPHPILTSRQSHKQNIHCETDEIVNIEHITQNPTANLRVINNNKNKPQSKTKIKIKKAPKKKKNKNNKKNNKKKQKKKQFKPKRQKQKKLNIKQKKNILTEDQINEMITNYELTYDQYQDFMNLRMSQRSGLSAYDYYEEIFGPITDDKIKEWSSAYHSN